MGKTQSKPLAAWHGRGTAWAQHGKCELAFTVVVNGTYDEIWNEETGHDVKPGFSQDASVYTQTNSF
jgi:hypothetical protein